MDPLQVIRINIDTGDFICMGYIADLTDVELMKRPTPGCNHINWQLGHLIASEHEMIEGVCPSSMPALPDGFAEKYSRSATQNDNPASFCTKEELLAVYRAQRDGTLAALNKLSPEDLDRATGVDYAPTVASMFLMQGSHWLMHAGQWAVVRRMVGRPPLF